MNNPAAFDPTKIVKPQPTRQRKSTLTQQQKNKKRQRATPHQLKVLRSEFEINQTPNAKSREEIGRRIDMTERSVQIWFQNKRAKNKILAKKQGNGFTQTFQFSMDTPYYGRNPGIITRVPNSVHPHIGSATFPSTFVGANIGNVAGNQFGPVFQNVVCSTIPMSQSFNMTQQSINIPCVSLSIGTWRRVCSSPNQMTTDLSVAYSPFDKSFSYTIFSNSTGFRIRYQLTSIQKLELVSHKDNPSMGDINVTLLQPPKFFIHTPKLPTWIACDDFSEMKQASLVFLHKLTGTFTALKVQLARISSLCSINEAASNTMAISIPQPNFTTPIFDTAKSGPLEASNSIASLPMSASASTNKLDWTLSVSDTHGNTSPTNTAAQSEGLLELNIPMSNTQSDSVASLLDENLIDIDALSRDDLFKTLQYDTSIISSTNDHFDEKDLNSVTSSIFCFNDERTNTGSTTLSTLSPTFENFMSNDQITDFNVSQTGSPNNSGNSQSGKIANDNHNKAVPLLSIIPATTSVSPNSEGELPVNVLEIFTDNNLSQKGPLLTPATETTPMLPLQNNNGYEPMTQEPSNFFKSLLFQDEKTPNEDRSMSTSQQLFEGANDGATDMMMSIGSEMSDVKGYNSCTSNVIQSEEKSGISNESKDVNKDLFITPSASLQDPKDSASNYFSNQSFSEELDSVFENLESDNSLLSLIEV